MQKPVTSDIQPQIRQVKTPCTHCGSYYRRGDYCNKCWSLAPVSDDQSEEKFSLAGRPPKGRNWDSKQRKYVK